MNVNLVLPVVYLTKISDSQQEIWHHIFTLTVLDRHIANMWFSQAQKLRHL